MNRSEQLISAVQQARFAHLGSLIHLFVGGSELPGAKVKNTDDLDIYGVYWEPPELVLGLDKQDFYVWSTAGDERRNGPDDIDVFYKGAAGTCSLRELKPYQGRV